MWRHVEVVRRVACLDTSLSTLGRKFVALVQDFGCKSGHSCAMATRRSGGKGCWKFPSTGGGCERCRGVDYDGLGFTLRVSVPRDHRVCFRISRDGSLEA